MLLAIKYRAEWREIVKNKTRKNNLLEKKELPSDDHRYLQWKLVRLTYTTDVNSTSVAISLVQHYQAVALDEGLVV